ncbi:hypothetical protein FEP95_03105 [Burkholderia multivorans]|nr:hypothetical protein [Burkholderia multivorans]MDR8808038.1 hypothetical protein [Burkholderia multivorans]
MGNVKQRAAEIAVDQVEDRGRVRREALDADFLVDENGRDLARRDDVVKIVVGLGGVLDPRLHLGVRGRQLLVHRLQLFLAAFEFLAGRAQLLVDRLQFLVRRLQLLDRRLILLDDRRELLAAVLQFVLELREHRILPACFGLILVGHAPVHLVEHDEQKVGVRDLVVKRPHRHVDPRHLRVVRPLDAARLDARARLQRAEDGGAQIEPQVRQHERHDVARQLAADVAQEPAGVVRQMNDVRFLVDDHARRRIHFKCALMEFRIREIALDRARRRAQRGCRHGPLVGRPRFDVQQRRASRRRFRAMRDDARLIDAALLVDDGKQIVGRVGRFRGAEEQIAVRAQREVKQLEDLPLHRPFEVDQHVAARDQIEMRERRIAQQAVRGEQNALAHRFRNHEMRAVAREIPLQQRFGHVGCDRQRIGARARAHDRRFVDVGREHLDRLARDGRLARAGEQQRDRIRFLARRAAGDPDAHLFLARIRREHRRDHLAFEEVECVAIAEELRDADQHVGEQRVRLVRRRAQEIAVREQVALPVDLHAPFDPAQHGRALVQPEVVPGAHAQMHQDVRQRAFGIVGARPVEILMNVRELEPLLLDAPRIHPQIEQFLRHLGGRQHDVRTGDRNRLLRHLRVFGVVGRLRERDAADFLDAAQPGRAVGARPGHHDADRARIVRVGQRPEKVVDRQRDAARHLARAAAKAAVRHFELHAGRDHVDMVLFDRDGARHLTDRHAGRVLQHAVHVADLLRGQMDDDDECHFHAGRRVLEEGLQGRRAACRCADAHDRKGQIASQRRRRGKPLLIGRLLPCH